jgi:amino acid transporter
MRNGPPRSWSSTDAFIYSFFSINLVTLGLYIISQAYAFRGGIIPALLVSGALLLTEAFVYAGLIAAMPRAGGDYLWQSRILGDGLGFVLALTGWCFILWLWTPLYADMLRHIVFVPLAAVLGWTDLALLIASRPMALFASCVLVCAFVLVVIAKGMRVYARVQRFCFWAGNAGLLVVIALLLAGNKETFRAGFDAGAARLFGAASSYAAIERAGAAAEAGVPMWGGRPGDVFRLMPLLAFFNLWPNCGASLYGEVNGSGDVRKNFLGMASALALTTGLAIVLLLAIDKGIGWDFYTKANASYWSFRRGNVQGAPAMPLWPYPALLALMPIASTPLRVAVILAMAAWFFGWAGTMYLSSTRFLLSAAIDGLLPSGLAKLDHRTGTPFNALLFMVVPGLAVSALFSFDVWSFGSLTFVSTIVIAVTFLGTGVAAVLLPYTRKALYEASPLVRLKIGRVPLISAVGLLFCAFLGYLLYEWLVDPRDLYGVSYRNVSSLAFMGMLYLLAAGIYLFMKRRLRAPRP